jgi:hypothetical protein
VDGGDFRCVLLDRREAVFIERPTAVLGKATQHDVVLLAAGEIHESERVFLVGHDAQVGLEAVLEHDTRLGLARREDAFDQRVFAEGLGNGGGVLGRDDDVDVVDGFVAAAGAAAGGEADGVRVRPQVVEQGGRGVGGDGSEVASGALLEVGETEEDFFLGLGPEAIEAGDFVVLAGFFQIGERRDLEFFVEGFDFFRTEAGNVEKFEQFRRELRDQFVVVGKLSRGDEGRDFFAEGVADPRDAFQFIFADERSKVVFEHFKGARTVVVGADLERIFALELEQKSDALEDVNDLVAGDRRHGEIVAAAGRLRREKTEECPRRRQVQKVASASCR